MAQLWAQRPVWVGSSRQFREWPQSPWFSLSVILLQHLALNLLVSAPVPRVHSGACVYQRVSRGGTLLRGAARTQELPFLFRFIQAGSLCAVPRVPMSLVWLSFYVSVSICFLQHKQEIFIPLCSSFALAFQFLCPLSCSECLHLLWWLVWGLFFFPRAGPQFRSPALLAVFCPSIGADRVLSGGGLHTFPYCAFPPAHPQY